MSTLYLQIDDLTADSYPVRLGVVDPARPGPVTLTQPASCPRPSRRRLTPLTWVPTCATW